MTPEWLRKRNDSTDFLTIMKGWWSEGQFRAKPSPIEWKTSKFRKSIQIIVILRARIFERKDASIFWKNGFPLFTKSSHTDQH